MPEKSVPTNTPEYKPFRWAGAFYQLLGGGPSICYVRFPLPGHDAMLVLQRYPLNSNNSWSVADVYVCSPETKNFETTSKAGFTPNTILVEGFSQKLNLVLSHVGRLSEAHNGCCCHYTRSNEREKEPVFAPDISVCTAKEHCIYRGANFVGNLWTPMPEKSPKKRTKRKK